MKHKPLLTKSFPNHPLREAGVSPSDKHFHKKSHQQRLALLAQLIELFPEFNTEHSLYVKNNSVTEPFTLCADTPKAKALLEHISPRFPLYWSERSLLRLGKEIFTP